MRENCASHAPQGSIDWLVVRSTCANASSYRTMTNADGGRRNLIQDSRAGRFSKKNYYMACGTCLEEVSGYVFSLVTGLSYKEYGSVPHAENPRIRSSVDGAGYSTHVDADGTKYTKGFVLETKTPPSHIPDSKLETLWYYYQIIQNIEVLDADYALFNNVRLSPVDNDGNIYSPSSCTITKCIGNRYNIAATASCPLSIVCSVTSRLEGESAELQRKRILELYKDVSPIHRNLIDLNGVSTDSFEQFKSNAYGYAMIEGLCFNPICFIGSTIGDIQSTNNMNDLHPNWTNQYNIAVEHDWKTRMHDEQHICYAVYMIDVINIQHIERQKEFWKHVLMPIAESYVKDFDNTRDDYTDDIGFIPYVPTTFTEHNILDTVPWEPITE